MWTRAEKNLIDGAKQGALEVLSHNTVGPCKGLPRTAGWGYPEPYTRDLMLSAPGFLVSGDPKLAGALERTLTALAKHQTERGHIPSLAHDPGDRGASDSTPLFLFGLALFRQASGQRDFLDAAAEKALTWMAYQSPNDMTMVAQLPTSDWRDEQTVFGYGLYVNTVLYSALRLYGRQRQATQLRELMNRLEVRGETKEPHVHEGLVVRHKPYYALYSYKIYNSDRFDLVGNSLAILSGVASASRSRDMVRWIEAECRALRERDDLAVDLPPCLFPYILPDHPDWNRRYDTYNRPGEYHNGGLWPYACALYVAACVAAGRHRLAAKRLLSLTHLVKLPKQQNLHWGFNEWIKAQNGEPCGQDWQTWSAAMYLYAAECVEQGRTPFFHEIRSNRGR